MDVTVVEKEPLPGGRMRGLTFGERGEYQVDTGPSIMQLPQVLERIFRRAGLRVEDYLQLVRLPENTRVHFWDGTHLDTHWDQQKMRAEVERLRPGLGETYERWFLESREKYRVAYGTFVAHPADSLGYYNPLRLLPAAKFKPWQSLYGHLDETFHDDRLSYAFSYPSKYLGLHPTRCSSVFSVIPFLELEFGVWHVMGGFRALAAGMKKAAEDLGARFRMSAPVKQVLVEQGRAVGVELTSGETLRADVVVVNADLPWAARNLIDPQWRRGSRLSDEKLEKAKYSCSTFMLYLGLDTKYALPHHLIYLSNAARRTDRAALEDRDADLEDPPFYVVNPSVTDPSGAPEGHSALYVLVPTPNTHEARDWRHVEQELTRKVPGWLAKVGMRDVERHSLEQAVRAIRNVIDGYGDRFVVPTRSLLDELASDFGHLEAGAELKAAGAHSARLVEEGHAAECDYAEAKRKETAIRFVIDAFNGRVDGILSRTKNDNFGTLEQEVRDAFALVNLNGEAFRNARVLESYLEARLSELKWAVSAQELRLREREEQRRIQEEIREEEKARRDAERAIKETEKEEALLQKALEKARAEISNVGSFGEDVLKIGMTRRLEPMDRIYELGDASVPFDFDVHAMITTDDAPTLERELHAAFDSKRVNRVNLRKEFFRVGVHELRDFVASKGLTASFTMAAEAREFRETLAVHAAAGATSREP